MPFSLERGLGRGIVPPGSGSNLQETMAQPLRSVVGVGVGAGAPLGSERAVSRNVGEVLHKHEITALSQPWPGSQERSHQGQCGVEPGGTMDGDLSPGP